MIEIPDFDMEKGLERLKDRMREIDARRTAGEPAMSDEDIEALSVLDTAIVFDGIMTTESSRSVVGQAEEILREGE